MGQIQSGLTRLKLPDMTASPVTQDATAPKHESPFTGVLKRLNPVETGTGNQPF